MSEIDTETPDGFPTFDPPSEYRATTLPDDLRPLVATAHGLDADPVTVGDWIAGLSRRFQAMAAGPLGFEDLCHLDADDGRHLLRAGDETWAFHCVFDALLVPFLDGGPAPPLVVHSRPPAGEAAITVEVDHEGVAVEPAGAVASLGVARSLADEPDAGFDPERAYGQLCAYWNAFPDRGSYETWAGDVEAEAATVAVPFRDAVGLARDLAVGSE